MRTIPFSAVLIVLFTGCGQSASTQPNGGPGRFKHAVIQKTIAPWDGAAVQIFLSEKPMKEGSRDEPHVAIRIFERPPGEGKQRIKIHGKEWRKGEAYWIEKGGKSTPVKWAEVVFDDHDESKPVQGTYEVAFPNGKRDRGGFTANWWKAEGPGG